MNTVFIVLGIVLVVLFLAWIFLVRPGAERKWLNLVLDLALIVVSVAVFATGFLLRNQAIEGSAPQIKEGGMLENLEEPQDEEGGKVLQLEGGESGDQKGGNGKTEGNADSKQLDTEGEAKAPQNDQRESEVEAPQDNQGEPEGKAPQNDQKESEAEAPQDDQKEQKAETPQDDQGEAEAPQDDQGEEEAPQDGQGEPEAEEPQDAEGEQEAEE